MPTFKTVADLLEDPSRWTKDAIARDSEDHELDYATDPKAAKWCLLGAIDVVYPIPKRFGIAYDIRAKTKSSVSAFNDHHSHEEVLNLVREMGI